MPERPDQAWAMDFVADQLVNGGRFRALTILDVSTREALAIRVGQKRRADHVLEECNRLAAQSDGAGPGVSGLLRPSPASPDGRADRDWPPSSGNLRDAATSG